MSTTTNEAVAIFGLPITTITPAQAVGGIERMILSGGSHQIAVADLDFARNALKDQYLKRIVCDCSMVLPETPMVWLSRLLGTPLKARVTGVDLISGLARLSAARGYGIYLLGETAETLRRATEALETRYPGVKIVGHSSPETQPLHEMDNESLLAEIDAASPDILLVALGSLKQEVWIHRHRLRLKVPVAIGVGGALGEIAGGGERAHRLRMSLRAVVDLAALLARLPLEIAVNLLQPGERRQGRLKAVVYGTVRVVATPAKMSGDISRWLAAEARAAAAAGQTLVVDMASTIRIEADGMAGLLEARRILLSEGLWIWLAGMSNPVRRVLQFAEMSDLFRIAASAAEAIRFTEVASVPRFRAGDRGRKTVMARAS